ncbi:MAG: SAM-dependent methyltransferase [Burkholderiaceae bacterium]|jgi:16S rRNA (cytidine1402-2'-O)-methyltransferase|nr:SAM-dependent methyltransferase [Burkholderiaceae bacterium]
MTSNTPGTLYLVPTPLDHGCDSQTPLHQVLPQGSIDTAAALSHWISENAKSTRAFLKRIASAVPLVQPIQAQHIVELPHAVQKKDPHASPLRVVRSPPRGPLFVSGRPGDKKGDHPGSGAPFDARPLLAPALQGHDIGLISEAGMPAVADPGSSVVRAAHELNLRVVPLVGPVSILLALAASGLNGQRFAFVGYLPQDEAGRVRQLKQLETRALQSGETQLFIETPYRNAALMRSMLASLSAATRLAVCSAVTLPQASVLTKTVAQWRALPDNAGLALAAPTVYAIGV